MKATDIFGEIPQKGISCSHYQLKSVQRKRVCSIRVSPLCASNNVTYPNSCVYCFANIYTSTKFSPASGPLGKLSCPTRLFSPCCSQA
ncbi:uncharacterized protein LOC114235365 isoform X1 [Eptesicus fuscus]|uniref:uncharacterized protein LOC114235365 isoform X1 n=1 Tax=Eptesicus fuscus TaxID=29078 RepID=UPI0024041CE8|nr:uncharacterized protein LOC114235365 isoform X1 [Eptesicus fuscus]